jgi:hypothetical protein
MYLKEHKEFKELLFSQNDSKEVLLLWKRLEELVSDGNGEGKVKSLTAS